MLKNIDPLLNPELLSVLRAMGHSDILIMSDTNFPTNSVATETVLGHALRVDASASRVADAILSVMPLDSFIDEPAMRMEVQDNPEEFPEVQKEVLEVVKKHGGSSLAPIDRFKFYDFAKKAYCVVTTAEPRFWGCFAFQKGVIPPGD